MANGEGVLWVGIDLLDLCILLGEEVQSELILLNCSIGKSVGCHVLGEGLLDGSSCLVLTDAGSEERSDSAEVHLIK